MSKYHEYLDLDGHLLQTFIAVYDANSVTKAADILGISQSTLSHRLERLRSRFHDPIFVKAGRGIVPTIKADEMISHAKTALQALSAFQDTDDIAAKDISGKFVIASTDLERELFLFDAYEEISRKAPNSVIQFVWESPDTSVGLRQAALDFAIFTPGQTADQDLRCRKLYADNFACFYNPALIRPPNTFEDYLNASHVRVDFADKNTSLVDEALEQLGHSRDISIIVPSILELPRLMSVSPFVATLPKAAGRTMLPNLEHCPPPFDMAQLEFRLCWHARTHESKKHMWLRREIVAAARKANL